jgi:GNAT superfamily N-acetyltransferase
MTLSEQIAEIRERIERVGIGLKDALSVIDMTLDDQVTRLGDSHPYEAFRDLNKLINRTLHGTRIERFEPKEDGQPFHTLEIHTEEGEVLAHLNMLYLSGPVLCYYLVYVEVMPPFRGLGLGNRILKSFMEFVEDRRAVALLDNIIPPDEPTYEIYTRLGWKNIKEHIGCGVPDGWGNYMVFIPPSLPPANLKDKLIRTLHSLRKKKAVIDMHDNEDMVKRTIEEFRSVYATLSQLFETELASGTSNPLMRFMFTRLTTKWIGFRRRIAALIGYTGGESLEQMSFSEEVKRIPIQPYSIWYVKRHHVRVWGEEDLLQRFPAAAQEEPTFFIEALPLYQRPYLHGWTKKREGSPSQVLKISDLLNLGFDPTRLKEFQHEGASFVFERVSPHLYPSLLKKATLLKEIEKVVLEARFQGAVLRINPSLLILRDRGNVYVLRRKVAGIHLEEALDQVRTSPYLREVNRLVGMDRAMLKTVQETRRWLEQKFQGNFGQEMEELTFFFPWDLEKNIPRIQVDDTGISAEGLWLT